jgi:hypothetical protein
MTLKFTFGIPVLSIDPKYLFLGEGGLEFELRASCLPKISLEASFSPSAQQQV